MRILSMNVWSYYMDNPVALREEGIYNAVMKYSPDIFGLQEMCAAWHNSNFSKWIEEEYTCIKISGENHVPIYYKKSKYELVECGWERFKDVARKDVSKSVAWAVIADKQINKMIGICNTHFWFMAGEEHDRVRDKNAQQLLEKMTYMKQKYHIPVFAFGDFNCRIGSSTMSLLEEQGIYTSFKLTEDHSQLATYHGYPVKDKNGQFHGEASKYPYTSSIDHIITYKDDVRINKQDVIVYPEILGATDHSPVYVDIEY